MSSMRNAVARRPHRERAQPAARQKWGILEKHKDYSLRAQDYNVKKKKLAQLSTKASERNPDEFAFGMLSKDKGRQGKHGQGSEENRLSHDAVKLLKSQDAGYLRVVLARGRKELKKVEEVVGLEASRRGMKVVFGDEGLPVLPARGGKGDSDGGVLEDLDMNVSDSQGPGLSDVDDELVATPEVDDAENVTAPKTKSRKALATERDAFGRIRAELKKRRRLQEMRAAKLDMLKRRQKEIMAAADQLELQRAKMARTVGGVNKNGVKFKVRERKK